eukprot:CAMPEP_0174851594 /NCGR_PEP_ID=MMETSP1114-20130205/23273_1 /TAXON_ID=312471 /ORGANISM="Neobodo designis, Strain CCAP 1951/1" /LENGTH=473 /DNA_ID=CAMNT_0016086139 /DNA_START=102 /DNA_END=1523 /DNA_ORIENTATION=-
MRSMQLFVAACLLLIVTATAVPAALHPIGDWMGYGAEAFANHTLLDLVLPGTHDTLTFDLSTSISDNANDLPPPIAALLHDLHDFAGLAAAVRRQATTQHGNLTQQLDAGMRFIDLRITFTAPPDAPSPNDNSGDDTSGGEAWYGLHMLQTVRPALEHLRHVKAWFDAHPTEVIVVWVSRHGSTCYNTFPGASAEQQRRFWRDVIELFGPLVFRNHRPWNVTTLHEYVHVLRQRVVFVVSDRAAQMVPEDLRDTAMDGCLAIDNQLGIDVSNVARTAQKLSQLRNGMAERRARDKANGRLYLLSMSAGATPEQISGAVVLRFLQDELHLPPSDVANITRACGESFHLPVPIPTWCPPTLASIGRLTNYYAQSFFESAVNASAGDPSAGPTLPAALYIDAVSPAPDGTLLTGESDDPSVSPRYAYVASSVLTSINVLCRDRCARLRATYETLRQAAPARFPVNTTIGRDGSAGW